MYPKQEQPISSTCGSSKDVKKKRVPRKVLQGSPGALQGSNRFFGKKPGVGSRKTKSEHQTIDVPADEAERQARRLSELTAADAGLAHTLRGDGNVDDERPEW